MERLTILRNNRLTKHQENENFVLVLTEGDKLYHYTSAAGLKGIVETNEERGAIDMNDKKYKLSIEMSSRNTLVIFDTNAWLDLYNIPPVALEEIIDRIEKKQDVFWIPHQVYREFCVNAKDKKDSVQNIFKKSCSESLQAVHAAKDQVLQKLSNLKKRKLLMDNNLYDEMEKRFKELTRKVKEEYEGLGKEYIKEIEIIEKNDIVDKLVNKIYGRDTSKDFSNIEKMKICEEGEIRYKYKIAPGYTDADKECKSCEDFFRKYGDLLIWKEILRKVEKTNTNVIFVQNEKKKDWLKDRNGNVLADVLLEEYHDKTCGNGLIEVCNFEAFLENYGESLGLSDAKMEKLINKLKFERSVIEYIGHHCYDIAEEQVRNFYGEEENLYAVFRELAESVYGGRFEVLDCNEIKKVEVALAIFIRNKEFGICRIEANYEIEGNGKLSEYVSKDINHVGKVGYDIKGTLSIELAVNGYSEGNIVEEGYEINKLEVKTEELAFTEVGDFDYDFKFDEDF